jgi:hypothetical protein
LPPPAVTELLRPARGALLPALAPLAAIAMAGCGSGDGRSGDVQGVGPARAGSSAALATCRDWRAGSADERLATIADLRIYVEGDDGREPALDDTDAYDLFERACTHDYAAGFKLYKVYARGAAFSGFAE